MSQEAIVGLVFWFPAFLFSTTVHEAAHAWAALRGGDRTAYLGGQVSLSPAPHIRREPVGMLIVPLLTSVTQGWAMGWASAPFDPLWAARHPRRAAWMAAAGPAGNLVIAVLAFALLRAGLGTGFFEAPESIRFSHLVVPRDGAALYGLADFAGRGLSVLLMLNVLLFAFNLIPLPPLDGSAVIDLVLPERMMGTLRNLGTMGSLLGLLIAWQVFPHVARPLFGLVIGLLHPGVRYG
jgi:Zn-dependent protease